ncbi:MAG: DUF1501 domain-containing protein [Acidobacteriota bacterium]
MKNTISRRILLKNGGLTMVGMGLVPSFVYRTALAAAEDSRGRKVLVAIFQRGGADGLNTVVPFGEKEYYRSRPNIAISAPSSREESALDLDGFFGLHPALRPLEALWKEKDLAIIHASGSPHSTRSHFDAQDFMETAAPGEKSISEGWLNRYLQASALDDTGAFRAVSMGASLPRSLRGGASAIALGNISEFDLKAGPAQAQVRSAYETLYDQETNSLLSGTAQEMFEAIDYLKKANPSQYSPSPKARYPQGRFGQNLLQVAQLIKADIGVEVAFVDIEGWDTHVNEGGSNGQLGNRLREFGQGLAAFHRDLGDRMEDVMVLTMSEFGRTVRENGNRGTDHGHANVMMLMGGGVKGQQLYGQWPGLAPEQRYEGRDLALTTDFRDVFAEVLSRHLGSKNPGAAFPGFGVDEGRFKGML